MTRRLHIRTMRTPEEIKRLLESVPDVDELDLNLILLLQENGRASYNELARMLGVSVATVSKRIKHLEQEGIIQGYAAIVSCERLGFRENLWLMIHVKPGADTETIGRRISDLIGVKCVYLIYSDFDLLVHLCCATNEEINRTVQAIGKIKDVVRVTKMTVNTKIKEEFRVLL
ncbi:MAG: Lrp/AsnC family transcriptional regulator [Candidatus Thorarchaeota archaeon]